MSAIGAERDAAIAHTNSIFEMPWWLDAVEPNGWREIVIKDGSRTVARLVYVEGSRYGVSFVRNPRLTQTVGPWMEETALKHEKRLARQRELAHAIAAQLPRHSYLRLPLWPGFDDFLPFAWAGYSVSLACTYRLTDLSDLDRVWANFSESCRRAIRKAERMVVVNHDTTLETALSVAGLTWARQGRSVPYDLDTVRRAVEECQRSAGAHVLVAEDASGRVHAAIVVVYDSRCAYYLLGGGDPELRASGAHSLLLWRAIQRVATTSATFDFEGSSRPEIERYFRGFGAERANLLVVGRASRWLKALGLTGLASIRLDG